MIFRFILSFISLIALVNFHGDIFAVHLFRTPARNAQVQMQRCSMCKQQKPTQECTATKFSVYCRTCLQASGVDVPTMTSNAPEQQLYQNFNRTAVVLCAALVTAGTYYIVKKIRARFQKQTQHQQTENTKVKQNEI